MKEKDVKHSLGLWQRLIQIYFLVLILQANKKVIKISTALCSGLLESLSLYNQLSHAGDVLNV